MSKRFSVWRAAESDSSFYATMIGLRPKPIDTRFRPELRRPDGRPLPVTLRVLRTVFSRGPTITRRGARYALLKMRVSTRLPEMYAHYPTGVRFRVPARDTMYRMIFTHGAYEPANTAVIESLLRSGDFAVDVGANHGWFALSMAGVVGQSGQVWAYEPTPPIHASLAINLRQNGSLRVRAKQLGISSESGQAVVHLFEGLPHGHASQSNLDRSDDEVFPIELVSLDAELDEAPSGPDLVKVDVEGAELMVIEGAQRLLAQRPPIWVIEVNWETSAAFGYRPSDIITALTRSATYTVFRVEGCGLSIEPDASRAPQNTTWVCVPDRLMERAEPLVGVPDP